MNYKSFNLGDWIGHISGVIEDESELDGNEMRDLVEFLTGLPKWIPVSKRLPQELDYVLCCDKDGYMTIGYIRISKLLKECWCFVDDEIDIDVVAWMPLPEPYKAESEDKE